MLYEQETELSLLLQIFERLRSTTVVDVGAEKGTFVDAFLGAGATQVFAFEPYPPHAEHLRSKYRDDSRVAVLDFAIDNADGRAILNVAQDNAGNDLDYFHTLREFNSVKDLRWGKQVEVARRSLGSLVTSGEVPPHIGILKVDTEGNDLQVLLGMGDLVSDIVVAEFWDGLEETLARCPYTLGILADELRRGGYSNFTAIKRNDEFEVIQVNSDATRPGDWGNAIFIRDEIFHRVADVFFGAAATASARLVDLAQHYRTECEARQRVIDELQSALANAVELSTPRQPAHYDLALLKTLNNAPDDVGPIGDRAELKDGRMPRDGLFVGAGWYPVERFEGATFRWVDHDAEVVVTDATSAHTAVLLDVEKGPGAPEDHLDLAVLDQRGEVVETHRLIDRGLIALSLPTTPAAGLNVFRLRPIGGGGAIPNDPRRLNFRVFRMARAAN